MTRCIAAIELTSAKESNINCKEERLMPFVLSLAHDVHSHYHQEGGQSAMWAVLSTDVQNRIIHAESLRYAVEELEVALFRWRAGWLAPECPPAPLRPDYGVSPQSERFRWYPRESG